MIHPGEFEIPVIIPSAPKLNGLASGVSAGRLAGNLLVAALYAVFVVSNVKFFLRTGSPVGLGLVAFNTLLVTCLLTRRAATDVTGSLRNWLVAPVTQILPFLFRPVADVGVSLTLVAALGQLAALVFMCASLLALNRCIGIVAANRGVMTSGPYRVVRHPLYAGEIMFFLSFVAGNPSSLNALLVALVITGQILRARQEEVLLERDDRYRAYCARVRYRFIPGVL